ncbi:MAG: ATP-binding cassette domain-containing protein [Candidatus Brocadiae bacterium]|nr:ATP-binding cassette domain-containing protein [Candidatus Brocadiia bacterium]
MTPTDPVIDIAELCKTLGGRRVLNRLSLQVRRGETLAIIGRSGTGKSVLLKHIVGLMKPDSGRCSVLGVDTATAGDAGIGALRRRVGYLFQSGALLAAMDVLENVALPLRECESGLSEARIRETVRETLALVNLEGVESRMPSELSGGMRKRVGLARAIVRRPELVLYDEPTSGLDPIGTSSIDDLIRSMKSVLNVTQVVVTHDMASARRIGDRIGLIWEGRIYFVGTPAELEATDDPTVRQFVGGLTTGPMTEGIGETQLLRNRPRGDAPAE